MGIDQQEALLGSWILAHGSLKYNGQEWRGKESSRPKECGENNNGVKTIWEEKMASRGNKAGPSRKKSKKL